MAILKDRRLTEYKWSDEILKIQVSPEKDLFFTDAPIPLWLLDFSELKFHLFRKYGSHSLNPDEILNSDESIKTCAEKIKILTVNDETLAMLGAENEKEVKQNPFLFLSEEAHRPICSAAIEMAAGVRRFSCELPIKTAQGKSKYVLLKLSLMPGYEKSLSKILAVTVDLTEYKSLEHEFKIKEAAFSSSLTGIGIEDLNGKLTYVNQTMAEMWGYSSPAEVVGTAGKQYWCDKNEAKAAFLKIVRNGSWQGELEALKKDGTPFYVKIRAAAVYNQKRKPILLVGSFEDITEQKRAQEAIRESEAVFHAFFQNNKAVILLLDVNDPNLPIVDANDAAVQFYGYSKQQLLRMTMTDLNILPPHETRERMKQYRRQNRETFVFQHRLASGEIRDVETYSGRIDVQGKKLVYVAIHDITERKRMEQDLTESEKRYRALAENSPNAIFVHADNKIIYANQKAMDLLNITKSEEIIGADILDFVPEQYKQQFKERMTKLYRGENTALAEYRFLCKDGKLVDVEIADSIVHFQGKPAAQCVFRDISHRKKAEMIQHFFVKISKAILSAEDLNDLFGIIHRALGEVMETKNFYIAIYDRVSKMILLPYFRDEKTRDVKLFLTGKNLVSQVIEDQQPYLLKEKEIDALISAGKVEILNEKPKVWLGVPLTSKNHVIGAIVVMDYRDENAYGREEMEVLQFVSDQIGLSIERKQTEEQIRQSLHEKTVLLKEIHHRVKNNLQVISSLLYLQSKNINDENMLKILEESRNRVRSMSLVHEKLYKSENLAQIPFKNYIVDLMRYLFRAYNVDPFRVRLETEIAEIFLSIDTAISCGLLINELISNALKHAFPEGRKGKIKVIFQQQDEDYLLIIQDDGIGIGDYLKTPEKSSLGLQLVDTLVDQINGKMEIKTDAGTEFIIKFKEKN